MKGTGALGIFDSGVGGLSVALEIRDALPREQLLYIADSAYCPYGERSLEEIRERSCAIARALAERGAKLIVVACNTASGAALEVLRSTLPLPVVGLEPAVKPAVASSRTGRIAVLATPSTLRSARFHRLVDQYGGRKEVIKCACPGFVERVEAGEISGPEVDAQVAEVLHPLIALEVDRVVLGCTHFPFLRGPIANALGPGVEILDSGAAVARQVARVLTRHGLRTGAAAGGIDFLTTGDRAHVGPVAERLWGAPLAIATARIPGSSEGSPGA